MRWMVLVLISFMMELTLASDQYEFISRAEQKRFNHLSSQLRCLVCQNQTLSDSNAPLAKDLRDKIYVMIQKGADDRTIIAYMVDRYGDFILFEPPVAGRTYFLWIAPFVLLGIGTLIVFCLVRRKKAVS